MLSSDRINDQLRALYGYRGAIIVDILKECARYSIWTLFDDNLTRTHEDWVAILTTYLGKYANARNYPPENKRALLLSLAAQTVAALEALDAIKRRQTALSPHPIVDERWQELYYG